MSRRGPLVTTKATCHGCAEEETSEYVAMGDRCWTSRCRLTGTETYGGTPADCPMRSDMDTTEMQLGEARRRIDALERQAGLDAEALVDARVDIAGLAEVKRVMGEQIADLLKENLALRCDLASLRLRVAAGIARPEAP